MSQDPLSHIIAGQQSQVKIIDQKLNSKNQHVWLFLPLCAWSVGGASVDGGKVDGGSVDGGKVDGGKVDGDTVDVGSVGPEASSSFDYKKC